MTVTCFVTQSSVMGTQEILVFKKSATCLLIQLDFLVLLQMRHGKHNIHHYQRSVVQNRVKYVQRTAAAANPSSRHVTAQTEMCFALRFRKVNVGSVCCSLQSSHLCGKSEVLVLTLSPQTRTHPKLAPVRTGQ